ncbi:hypothetical protein [Chryseobacterium oncorhynchi]|uniref:Phage morphogenesis protein n=1 Tax=Chryseobacterium oncorhynchi TaxID=741074 RepID=A0A316X9S2_9FLAO|nr:hypothetical protein [Chryseobacterium oncorhynchi]PWN67600.1 hypothetical protein C1638_003140 [Chryseobacterium oncorhynchi]
MGLSEKRNRDVGIIEGLFIRKTLEDHAKTILEDTKRQMVGFTNRKWNKRGISVNDNTLVYSHISAFRFVDMKTVRAKSGYSIGSKKVRKGKIKKNFFPIHNTPIFSSKRFLIKRLSFGFTDEVKNSFEQLAKDSGLLNE